MEDTLQVIEDRLIARRLLKRDGRVSTEALLLTSAAVALFVANRDRTVTGQLAGTAVGS